MLKPYILHVHVCVKRVCSTEMTSATSCLLHTYTYKYGLLNLSINELMRIILLSPLPIYTPIYSHHLLHTNVHWGILKAKIHNIKIGYLKLVAKYNLKQLQLAHLKQLHNNLYRACFSYLYHTNPILVHVYISLTARQVFPLHVNRHTQFLLHVLTDVLLFTNSNRKVFCMINLFLQHQVTN